MFTFSPRQFGCLMSSYATDTVVYKYKKYPLEHTHYVKSLHDAHLPIHVVQVFTLCMYIWLLFRYTTLQSSSYQSVMPACVDAFFFFFFCNCFLLSTIAIYSRVFLSVLNPQMILKNSSLLLSNVDCVRSSVLHYSLKRAHLFSCRMSWSHFLLTLSYRSMPSYVK